MLIGSTIKSFRKEKGLTQKSLAEKAQISRSYLADIENDRYNPSVEVLKSISAALELNLSVLLEEETIEDTTHVEFTTPEEAMQFILQQPTLMAFGGYDLDTMNGDELIEFANELLRQFKLISYKYKK